MVKPKQSHESSIRLLIFYKVIIQRRKIWLYSLKTELFNNSIVFFLTQIITMWKNICHYDFLLFYVRSKH